jgi:hypothetical protein
VNAFQVFGAALAATMVLWTARGLRRGGRLGRMRLAWLVLWLAAGVAILRPELTTAVARRLGIGRGADLVMYLAILGGAAGFFLFYLRLVRIEGEITRLARHVALDEAERSDLSGEDAPRTPGPAR